MADRQPQYPMLTNFNPNITAHQLQQQQQQQQQLNATQQPQVDSSQSGPRPGFPNADHTRMWQQMQHIQNQQGQQQFRPQGNGEMGSQQMADLLRGQSITRIQSQGQQQQQQQQSQQFGLGIPQMGGQQSPFLTQANPQLHQSHNPSNFGNGINSSAAAAAVMQQRMMQGSSGPANQGQMSRQLEMLQNGVGFAPTRMGQQSQPQPGMNGLPGQNRSPQPDIFSSPSMAPSDTMRASPIHHPTANSQQMQLNPNVPGAGNNGTGMSPPNGNGGLPAGRRPMTFNELRERARQLRDVISVTENQAMQLANNRAGMSDAMFMPKMASLQKDIQQRKEVLTKVMNAMHQVVQMRPNGAPAGGLGNLNAMSVPPSGIGGALMTSQAQPAWVNQGASIGGQFANPQMNQGRGPSPSNPNMQSSPPNMHTQAASMMNVNAVPPRSGPTPQQGTIPGQFPGAVGNGIAPPQGGPVGVVDTKPISQAQSRVNEGQPSILSHPQGPPFPPPLEKAKFETTYPNFCKAKNIVHSQALMIINGQPLDLYALHYQVMSEGGVRQVAQKDLWAVLGARMGFVQFPGTDSEPAKAGPGVAQHLVHAYKEYLLGFDQVYVQTVTDQRRKMFLEQHAAAQNRAMNPGAVGARPPSLGGLNAMQMQMVVSYANQSAADLRAQGISEKIIQFVEANRHNLQRTAVEQGMFRGQLRTNQGIGGPSPGVASGNTVTEQDRIPSTGPLPFGVQHPNSASPHPPQHGMHAQPFLQPGNAAPQPGANFMDTRQFHAQNQRTEMLQSAVNFIQKTKQDYMMHNLPLLRPQDIPNDQRLQFNTTVEQLHRYAQDLDSKLPMYYVVLKQEETIKRLVAIILTIQQQRTMLANNPPRFLVNLDMLKMMLTQIQRTNEAFMLILSKQQQNQQQQQQQGLPHPIGSNEQPDGSHRPPTLPSSQPPTGQNANLIPHRPPVQLQAPPPRRNVPSASANGATSSPAAITQPTPPANPSTPAANAGTPATAAVASSPQATPKSPKTKTKNKTVNKQRRPSRAQPPVPSPVSAEQSHESPSGALKRQRDDEGVANSDRTSNPSPKRPKTELDAPIPVVSSSAPSVVTAAVAAAAAAAIELPDVPAAKQEDVDKIKTEEDASEFLEKMTELIKMAGEGQEGLNADISETLDMILKGYSAVPEVQDNIASSSLLTLDMADPRNTTQASAAADEFVEFFDFSSFCEDEDDAGSKAPTPDLVSSSSANPSPESNADAEAKGEDLDLRLGPSKVIDGGESAYYTSNQGDWKWDSPMATSEQPWAIFTS